MSGHKDKKFNERLSTAAEAKKALLEKFRARPAAMIRRSSLGRRPARP
jgi:hypothetical protein